MKCFSRALPLATLVALLAAPAQATTYAEATVRELIGSGSNVICTQGGTAFSIVLATCSGQAFFGDGRAEALPGSVATYAELTHPNPPNDNSQDYQTYGVARFADVLEIQPTIPGVYTDARLIMNIIAGPGAFIPRPSSPAGTSSSCRRSEC